jgi:hypothetical protein
MANGRPKRSDVVRPSLLWFLLLDGGIVLLARLALSGRAHRRGTELSRGGLPPREVLQALLVATACIHAGEALAAGRMAQRRGLSPRGWRLQTFIVGFPSLLAMRRAATSD